MWRYKNKGEPKENLEKVLWYINYAMDSGNCITNEDYLETLSLPDTLDDFQISVLSDIIALVWHMNPETKTETYNAIRDEIARKLETYTG